MTTLGERDTFEVGKELRNMCESIIENIMFYYDGWIEYLAIIEQYQEISDEQWKKG